MRTRTGGWPHTGQLYKQCLSLRDVQFCYLRARVDFFDILFGEEVSNSTTQHFSAFSAENSCRVCASPHGEPSGINVGRVVWPQLFDHLCQVIYIGGSADFERFSENFEIVINEKNPEFHDE